ncbi:hypothetical protein [Mangrovibacterium marinum]|uniref:Uncharacterized protein n=1 Tax=Mangrovibacterium marinum TaxID=1639118 RepID=A0A2T5BXA1_9BACT|nr:hypothetical protein [Mangrovibacterium marinum]PTN04803.1 hypothetical protein C8N47_12923 [Mangrovibacterium marinum]
MKQFIRIVAGILTGCLPIIGASMFSILIYTELQSFVGIIIALVLFLGAVWFGVIVFKAIYRQGFLKFMTPVFSVSDWEKPDEEEK